MSLLGGVAALAAASSATAPCARIAVNSSLLRCRRFSGNAQKPLLAKRIVAETPRPAAPSDFGWSFARGLHTTRSTWEAASPDGHDPEPLSRQADLRARFRWDFPELLRALDNDADEGGTQTLLLLNNPKHAPNAGSVLRQANLLQGVASRDLVPAVILGCSLGEGHEPTQRMLKSALRVSMVERHVLTQQQTKLVVLPPGSLEEPMRDLKARGFILVALENVESIDAAGGGKYQATAVWDARFERHKKLVFIAGGEDVSLTPDVLDLCDLHCYIPASECPLANAKDDREQLGQAGQNPSLNLAHALVIALYERRRQLCRRRPSPENQAGLV